MNTFEATNPNKVQYNLKSIKTFYDKIHVLNQTLKDVEKKVNREKNVDKKIKLKTQFVSLCEKLLEVNSEFDNFLNMYEANIHSQISSKTMKEHFNAINRISR